MSREVGQVHWPQCLCPRVSLAQRCLLACSPVLTYHCSAFTGASRPHSACVASAAECLLATTRKFPKKALLMGKLEKGKALTLLPGRRGAKLPLTNGQLQGLGFSELFCLLLLSGPWDFNAMSFKLQHPGVNFHCINVLPVTPAGPRCVH